MFFGLRRLCSDTIFISDVELWHIYPKNGHCHIVTFIIFQLIVQPSCVHSPPYCHWLVQWHSNEWGLPSMTKVIFSFSPICHLLRSSMWEKQHGSMWHSMVDLGTALGSTVCFDVCACMCVFVRTAWHTVWWKVVLYYTFLLVPGHWQIS